MERHGIGHTVSGHKKNHSEYKDESGPGMDFHVKIHLVGNDFQTWHLIRCIPGPANTYYKVEKCKV